MLRIWFRTTKSRRPCPAPVTLVSALVVCLTAAVIGCDEPAKSYCEKFCDKRWECDDDDIAGYDSIGECYDECDRHSDADDCGSPCDEAASEACQEARSAYYDCLLALSCPDFVNRNEGDEEGPCAAENHARH